MNRPCVLVVEDDCELAGKIAGELGHLGCCCTTVNDAGSARDALRGGDYDLVIMDRILPDQDSIALIEDMRAEKMEVPVLVLSALSAPDERVRGLRAGGDDYLTKPFVFAELAARVEALLRRRRDTRETVLRVGNLTADLVERTVRRGAREIDLLPREFKLLTYMMRRPNLVVSRAMLFEDVWNYTFVPHSNLVDVHMGKLRRKIDSAGEAPLIESVVGVGFVLRAPV